MKPRRHWWGKCAEMKILDVHMSSWAARKRSQRRGRDQRALQMAETPSPQSTRQKTITAAAWL